MHTSPVALIAALLAAAVMFASSAQAGFRVRLGFGGPLPAFTAHGGGYSGERQYYRKRYVERRVTRKKEKVHVAKRKTTSEPKVAMKDVEQKVAKKEAPEPKTAKKEKSTPKRQAVAAVPAEPGVSADSENSSIASDELEAQQTSVPGAELQAAAQPAVAQVPPPERKPAQSVSKLDCKKFFPSVGMTLTVPCE